MRNYFLAVFAFIIFASGAAAAEDASYTLTIKDHKFTPATLTIPAGQKIKLIVKNQDASPAEFESYDLNREKVVDGNSEITVYIGPLNAGNYTYFDDFHKTTTTGTIVAK